MIQTICKSLLLCCFCSLSLGIAGCSSYPAVAPNVDAKQALEILRTTLDSWKEGKNITELSQDPPKIVAQDFDWMQSRKLMGYEIQGEGTPQDANLRVEVLLTLEGISQPKKVIYIVGTAPAKTVFRALE